MDSVICQVCQKGYGKAFNSAETCLQGADCAAAVIKSPKNEYYIQAFYGSRFDGDLWKFVRQLPPRFLGADPVCDTCIRVLIEETMIEYVGDFFWGVRFLDDGTSAPATFLGMLTGDVLTGDV